jgi:APA family basic amino acid/polyamine antiporter
MGVVGAAASIFFAYVGFDAVSTAAEETKNPQRNVPIGLIGSLAICTVFYLLVAAGAIGAVGAQPVLGPRRFLRPARLGRLPGRLRHWPRTPTPGLLERGPGPRAARDQLAGRRQSAGPGRQPGPALGHPDDDLRPDPHLLRHGPRRPAAGKLGHHPPQVQDAAHRDHLHGRFVAIAAAFFPVGQLADISNSGTLFAFFMVAIAVMVLRVKDPNRPRPFKTPLVWVVAPLAMVGCAVLYFNLPLEAMAVCRSGAPGPGDLLRLRLPQEPRRSRLDRRSPRTGRRRSAHRRSRSGPRLGLDQAFITLRSKGRGSFGARPFLWSRS